MNDQRAQIAQQFNRKVALLKGMGDAVVGHFFEGQLSQMILRNELIKAVRRDDRHRRDIDLNVRKGSAVNLLGKEIFDEHQSAGLATD